MTILWGSFLNWDIRGTKDHWRRWCGGEVTFQPLAALAPETCTALLGVSGRPFRSSGAHSGRHLVHGMPTDNTYGRQARPTAFDVAMGQLTWTAVAARARLTATLAVCVWSTAKYFTPDSLGQRNSFRCLFCAARPHFPRFASFLRRFLSFARRAIFFFCILSHFILFLLDFYFYV